MKIIIPSALASLWIFCLSEQAFTNTGSTEEGRSAGRIAYVNTESKANIVNESSNGPKKSEAEPDTTKKWQRKKPNLHGFIQVFYRYAFETGSDGVVDNDNFRVQRVRLKVDGKVLPWVSYEVDIDPRAPEITGILRDAFIILKIMPTQQIQLGQQKMAFGYENSVSSSRLFAVNRTELSDNISRGLNLRDIGLALKGKISLSKKWRLEDHIALSNGAGMNVQEDNTEKMNFWSRLGIRYKSDNFMARLGGSFATGDMVDSAEYIDFNRFGFDLALDTRLGMLSMEYAMAMDSVEIDGLGETDEISGFYVNLVGKTPWPVGPIARLDLIGDEFRRWLFGAYYGKSSDRFRVLINYELREIFEDNSGHIGRGDDKFYVWTQVRF